MKVLRCCCWASVVSVLILAIFLANLARIAILPVPDAPLSKFEEDGVHRLILKDGRSLEYAEAGSPSGSPLLFLHGSMGTGRSMCRFLDAKMKANHKRLICPTAPGYGLSSWTDAPTERYVDDIVELALHLGIDKFESVAGGSAGGLLATVVVSGRPDLFGALFLSVAAPPQIDWYDHGLAMSLYVRATAHTRVNEVMAKYLVLPIVRKNCSQFFLMSSPPEELALIPSELWGPVCEDMLRSVSWCERGYISMPEKWFRGVNVNWENVAKMSDGSQRKVIILYGAHDTLITPKAAREYHRHIPGSILLRHPGGHGSAGLDIVNNYGIIWGEPIPSLLTRED